MIYLIRLFWPLYLGLGALILIAFIAETIFEHKRTTIKKVIKVILFAATWPLGLANARGRSIIKLSFKKFI